MKRRFQLIALLFAAAGTISAQLMSSHAPSVKPDSAFDTTTLQQPAGKPVARVNGAVLTDFDLMNEMLTIFPYARQHNGGVPKAMEADIRKGAMQMIEFEELVYQEAVRRKMTVPPARMQKAELDFRKQFNSPDEYQQFLKQVCQGSRQVLRAKIRRSLLIEDLLKGEIEAKSVVSVAEARAYYTKNPARFRIPESYAIQTISILPPQNASAAQLQEARKKADDALKQAKATKNYEEFGVLAEKISQDDWRVMMGDHHAVDKNRVTPAVWNVIAKMQPGQVSDLIQAGQAYTIVRLNAHIPEGTQKFEVVKDALRKELQKKKVETLRAALNQRLRKNAKVEEL